MLKYSFCSLLARAHPLIRCGQLCALFVITSVIFQCAVYAKSFENFLPNTQPVNYKPYERIISGTYFTGSGGNAWIDWAGFAHSPFVSYTANPTNGSSLGFSTGYRFYSYFAVDGGFFKMPTVKGMGHTNASKARPLNLIGVESWFGYAVGRFLISVVLIKYFYFTLGAGIAYRQIQPKPAQLFTNNHAYYYAPIFNLGAEYDITQNWMIFMNYFFIPAYNRELSDQPTKFFNVPAINLAAFGIGYKLSV